MLEVYSVTRMVGEDGSVDKEQMLSTSGAVNNYSTRLAEWGPRGMKPRRQERERERERWG